MSFWLDVNLSLALVSIGIAIRIYVCASRAAPRPESGRRSSQVKPSRTVGPAFKLACSWQGQSFNKLLISRENEAAETK